MRVTTVTEAIEPVQELPVDAPEELTIQLSDGPTEDSEAAEPVELEPQAPAEPPAPAGPTPEELAAERAEVIISQAGEKAGSLVENAQRRADELIRMAEEEAEQVIKAARKNGYEEGAEQAKLDAKAELEAKMREDDELLRNVIDVIHRERVRMADELEGEVVKLTLAVAEKIIKLAGENDDKIFESLIINALKQMNVEGKITIRVGVLEYDRFFSSGSAVFALEDGTTVTASVMKDAALSDGDCIIDSDDGTVNAGIGSQLRYIELAFNEAGGE